ncbi:MAG: hypothetical protein JSR61_21530 [Proteobacteria bacterium]|nr:hypothetical protein [Pseudomonadota bacterium]
MRAPLLAAAAAALIVLTANAIPAGAASGVPQFNVQPSCKAATQAADELNRAGDNLRPGNRSSDNCVSDELNAKAKLGDQWERYTSAQRQHCTRLATLGGLPSYVELLTCLEMAKEAANIPAGRPAMGGRPSR